MLLGTEDDYSNTEHYFPVSAGDVVLIPDGAFHKVFNESDDDLEFVCVFEKYER